MEPRLLQVRSFVTAAVVVIYVAAGVAALYFSLSAGVWEAMFASSETKVTTPPGDFSRLQDSPFWLDHDPRLEKVVATTGPIPVPSLFPKGFELLDVQLMHAESLRLTLRTAEQVSPVLIVAVGKQGYQVSGPEEFVSALQVNGQTARLVRGEWVKEGDGFRWEPSTVMTVLVQHEGWTVEVSGRQAEPGGRFWSAEDLSLIAGSLKMYP